MSVLDEMRKRVESNKANIVTKNTALDEMRKRVNERKNEIDKQNKKAQEFNQYMQNNDLSNVQGLKLPNALSHERVNEILQDENKKKEEIEYFKNNPATFGSNLNRNLLKPIGRTLRNIAIATGDSAVDIAEYLYELQAVPLSLKELTAESNKTWDELIKEKKSTPSKMAQYTESVRQRALQKTQELPTPLARKIAESGMVVGDMVPSIALGATPLGAYGSTIGIFARSASNAQQETLNNGATYEQARLNGVLNGLLETTAEMIGGKAIGKLTKMPTLTSKIGGKLLSKAPKGVKTFLELLKDVGEEGLEEMISDFVQPYIDRVTYNPEAPLANFKSQWEAFSSSIIPSLMFAGINAGASKVISYTDKQMTIKSVNNQINNLANKQIEQIENTDLSMTEKVALINDVKKQQIEAKNKFAEEINKFETTETTIDTNLKTTPQNYTNFAKTTPINEKISQNNVQNVPNLQKTVQNNSNIQGLEDYTEQDIKDLVSDYIQDLDTNVQIKGVAINGSRARGDSQVTSDLDVVVEYDGDMSEDALFNILNEEPLTIEGIQVNINPITASKSGTLEQYMQKSKEYDNSKNVDIMEDREYNSYRTVERKEDYKEGEIHASFTLQPSEFEQVRSEVSQNRRNDQDGLHYIDLSKNGYFSYIYKKQGDSITPIVQLRGHEDVLNFVRRRIENGNYKEYGTARRWSSVIRNEYRNYNGDISDMQYERQTDKNDVNNGRQNRQQSKDNRRRTDNRSEENSTTIENSEEQGSFSMPEVPKNHIRLYRGLNEKYNANYDRSKLDNVNGYESWTDNYELAKQYGENVYYIDLPLNKIGDDIIDQDGERFLAYKNDKPVALNNIPGNEYMLYTYHDDFENIQYNETSQNSNLPKTDNQGRKLTKEQQEYFKDSKVRDDEGRLLEVYHGTQTKGINIFQYDPKRQTGTDYGEAYYFTSDYTKAEGYGYDITKDPRFIESEKESEAARKRMVAEDFSEESRKHFDEVNKKYNIFEIMNDEEYMHNNYDIVGGEVKKLYLNLANPLIVDAEGQYYFKVYDKYFKQARENGNDGIIVKNVIDVARGEHRPIDVYIAFNNNQFKNVDNTNPTDNPDTRYDIELKRDDIIQKIVDTLNVDIKSNKATLKQAASEIKTLIKGNQFTIDNIDRIIGELGNKLKAVNAPEQKGQRRRSLATYWAEELGYDSWHEVAEELKAQLIELRNDYGELETDKKAIAASPEIRDVLKQAGFTEFEIYDPANAYIQNILEILEKDKDYYAKTLKQIEQETFVTGEKRMNTILNKRRHDVQSGKTPANPNYLKGASLSSMRKEVEKYLGKKVGLKGFRKRAYGIYKLNLDTIRVKDISNMETTIHELGHRINFKELDKDLEGASRKELNELAERAFLNMYDDEPAVKLQEGWAEFTKRFVVDNQTTLKEYPELSKYMLEQLSNNPRVEKVITSLIDMAEQYVNAPTEAQIRKMQSIGEDTGKQEERSFFDKYMYEVHDDLWDIKQMTRAFAKSMNTSIWKLAPSDNVYNLMRTLRANEDRVLNVMKFGLIDDSGIRRTKGMAEIMERLNNDPEKAQRVRDLLIAMRTLDYASVSLETGLAPEEALSLIAKYSKDTDVMNAANDIINFQEEIMKYAVSKGLMKVEDYQEMKKWNKLYIPLKRVFEGKENSSNSKMGASNLTKRRTGSSREIIDPFESIIQNTAMILTKINQNEIIKTLADLQQKTGLADYFEEVDPGQRLKAEVSLEMFRNTLEAEGVDTDEIDLDVVKRIFSPVMNDDKTMTIGYMDNGKLKAIEFKDKNIYDVLTGADNGLISKTNLVLNALDKFTGLLRLGATTGNLEFALPNMVADTTAAWIFSESGFIPAVDTMRGLVDYMVANYDWAGKLVKEGKYKQNNKYMYDLYKQSGATMATRVASYRPEVQEYVLEVFGKHVNDLMSADLSKTQKAGKAILKGILKAPQKVQDILSIFPELSEQATRFESFKKDYNYFKKKGYSHKNALLQATVNTRDITMDFNRMGHSMRAYNRIKAFSATRAQGIYRFVEGVEKMPKKVLSKVGLLTAISLSILTAANASGNDKEKEITDQKRKDNFIIPLGANGDIVTIKKPQGTVRSIINFAELIYNVGTGQIKEENYNQAWLNWVRDTVEENSPIELDLKEGNDFFSVISSASLPTALEPIIENALNRDFYYGNPIIPYGKEDLRPEDQYDENTSQTAILIGKALKQSPAKVENLITGWFAGVGQQVLDISDFVLGKTVPSIPEAPKKNKDEAFITKRFFVSGYKNSESISQVYDMIDKLEDLKEYNEATDEQIEQLKKLNTAKETMSLLNKKMKAIRNDLSLSAKQKQKEILNLQELRTDTARYYLGKTLIKNINKRQIELYEYYPASTEYKYKPKNGLQVNVQYTEKDQQRYAEIWKETYEEELLKFEISKKYYTMTDEERKKEIESIRTKARNKAQDEVSKEVYEREH